MCLENAVSFCCGVLHNFGLIHLQEDFVPFSNAQICTHWLLSTNMKTQKSCTRLNI